MQEQIDIPHRNLNRKRVTKTGWEMRLEEINKETMTTRKCIKETETQKDTME